MKRSTCISSLCLLGVLMMAPTAFAHEEYKNLKLLADNGETLEKGMKQFSKGLGVKCNACHVKGKFDSDEKASKEKARTFFKTVLGTKDKAARDTALATLLKDLGQKKASKPDRLWKGIEMLKLKAAK